MFPLRHLFIRHFRASHACFLEGSHVFGDWVCWPSSNSWPHLGLTLDLAVWGASWSYQKKVGPNHMRVIPVAFVSGDEHPFTRSLLMLGFESLNGVVDPPPNRYYYISIKVPPPKPDLRAPAVDHVFLIIFEAVPLSFLIQMKLQG